MYLTCLYLLDSIDIRWGDLSLVKAEFMLLNEALSIGHYEYYHLLSGQDLPIKSQDYIHDFFCKHAGTNFVGFAQGEINSEDLYNKVSYYTPFTGYYNIQNRRIQFALDKLRVLAVNFQKKLSITRKCNGLIFKKGSQWFSITDDFARYVLHNSHIISRFCYVPAADEIFLQTLIWNSNFRSTLYSTTNEFEGCVREIDWLRGRPYVWKQGDYDYLRNSTKLFARKFVSEVDRHIIDEIFDSVISG